MEKRRIREEKKAERKSKDQKCCQTNSGKATKIDPTDLEHMVEELDLASDTSTEDEAICPSCGKLFSTDEPNELWVFCDKCSQWYV